MTNPYEPPTAEAPAAASLSNRSYFIGGFGMIALLAVVVGSGVGILIGWSSTDSAIYLFGIPLLGWFIAMIVMSSIARNSPYSALSKVLLGVVLVVPAYTLYVPVCIVTSMVSQSYVPLVYTGSPPLGPGIIIGSSVSFLAILLSIAVILRVCCKVTTIPTGPTPEEGNDQRPEDEFS